MDNLFNLFIEFLKKKKVEFYREDNGKTVVLTEIMYSNTQITPAIRYARELSLEIRVHDPDYQNIPKAIIKNLDFLDELECKYTKKGYFCLPLPSSLKSVEDLFLAIGVVVQNLFLNFKDHSLLQSFFENPKNAYRKLGIEKSFPKENKFPTNNGVLYITRNKYKEITGEEAKVWNCNFYLTLSLEDEKTQEYCFEWFKEPASEVNDVESHSKIVKVRDLKNDIREIIMKSFWDFNKNEKLMSKDFLLERTEEEEEKIS